MTLHNACIIVIEACGLNVNEPPTITAMSYFRQAYYHEYFIRDDQP